MPPLATIALLVALDIVAVAKNRTFSLWNDTEPSSSALQASPPAAFEP
jgi:hypothetical protein